MTPEPCYGWRETRPDWSWAESEPDCNELLPHSWPAELCSCRAGIVLEMGTSPKIRAPDPSGVDHPPHGK